MATTLDNIFSQQLANNSIRGDSLSFHLAKRWTLVGAGLGMLVWFGLFHVLGGALFQQWQTQAGDGSLRGAFWYGAMMALVSLYRERKEWLREKGAGLAI